MNPILFKDFYKTSHFEQYPPGTEIVFSNFTPRKSRIPGCNYSILFGLKYFVDKYLIDEFNTNFFGKRKQVVIDQYRDIMEICLNSEKEYEHIGALYDLGYLPLSIYSLQEGIKVPEGVPALVMFNTDKRFYWLTNMLETILSCTLWGPSTSATTASLYHEILTHYATTTSDNPEFVSYQAHDFSFRGMYGLEAAMLSGGAHLLYFKGTDTIPAILFMNRYYGMPFSQAYSVPATEHSVMSAYGKENELACYARLITEVYPSGIVSIVSDTYDLWNVIENYLPILKDKIMEREGKVTLRPDSGVPSDIICGDITASNPCAIKGVIESLWDIFGGTINSKGFKELDPHIGAIYGDSISLETCKEICERLENKGFASTNIIFGIGSYSYQMVTRDTLGWAVKATYAVINGKPVEIYKDPVTDSGIKKSHRGLLKVIKTPEGLKCLQQITKDEFYADDNELKLVFQDGVSTWD